MKMRRTPTTLALMAAGVLAAAPYALAEPHGVRYGRIGTMSTPVKVTVVSSTSDLDVEQNVHDSLEMSLGPRADAINVDVRAGTVYLTGWVATESDRRIAHDAVYGAYGVQGLNMINLRASTYRY